MTVDGNIGCSRADIRQDHSHLPLVAGQSGLTRGDGVQHQAIDRCLVPFNGLDRVLDGGCFAQHYMGFQLNVGGIQAGGITHAGKAVNFVTNWDHMQYLLG